MSQGSLVSLKLLVCRGWLEDLKTTWLELERIHVLDILLVAVLEVKGLDSLLRQQFDVRLPVI